MGLDIAKQWGYNDDLDIYKGGLVMPRMTTYEDIENATNEVANAEAEMRYCCAAFDKNNPRVQESEEIFKKEMQRLNELKQEYYMG